MIIRKAFWLFGIAFLLLIMFLPGYTKLQELRDRYRDSEVKIRELSIENKILQQELKRIENDPIYQEKIAREKLGIVRKGEVPVKIVPEEKY
ncbi:MAG: septum formation initiator family protein [Candidatus Omnitrophica bacterium]|nr:septum formation initiator family protein [Candidatus Omnitrophota bacterium]